MLLRWPTPTLGHAPEDLPKREPRDPSGGQVLRGGQLQLRGQEQAGPVLEGLHPAPSHG